MKLSRQHLSVGRAAASLKEGRPVLASIYAYHEDDQTVAVATDSFRLFECRALAQEDEGHEEPIMVPIAEVKVAEDMIKPHKDLQHLEFAPELISVNGSTHEYEQTEGTFPAYKQLLPKPDGKPITVSLNIRYVKDAMEFFKDMDASGVTFEVRGPLDPVILRAKSGGVEKMAVIMPLRT